MYFLKNYQNKFQKFNNVHLIYITLNCFLSFNMYTWHKNLFYILLGLSWNFKEAYYIKNDPLLHRPQYT